MATVAPGYSNGTPTVIKLSIDVPQGWQWGLYIDQATVYLTQEDADAIIAGLTKKETNENAR